MRFILSLGTLVTAVLAAPRTVPPPGAITVGSGGNFATIQAAINSLLTTSPTPRSIFILPGTYSEQVRIPKLRVPLKIYGYTADTSSYKSNVVTITHSSDLKSAGSDKDSGTVINEASNTAFYNINIKNTFGTGSQAIALAACGTRQAYYGVGLYGYQDTLMAQVGKQFYSKCYIEGAVDFIFGQHAVVLVTLSDIRVSAEGAAVTASGRLTAAETSMYVIDRSSIDKTPRSTIMPGTVYLGRPWSQYARVIVQKTALSSIINAAGWKIWQDDDPHTAPTLFLAEFANTGPGATGKRFFWGRRLRMALTISNVLGIDHATWVDAAYM